MVNPQDAPGPLLSRGTIQSGPERLRVDRSNARVADCLELIAERGRCWNQEAEFSIATRIEPRSTLRLPRSNRDIGDAVVGVTLERRRGRIENRARHHL